MNPKQQESVGSALIPMDGWQHPTTPFFVLPLFFRIMYSRLLMVVVHLCMETIGDHWTE